MWKYSGLAAAMQRARALGKPWRIGVIAGILIAAIGGAGLAAGAIPDSGGVIHGCYLNKIGTLRVIDSAARTNPSPNRRHRSIDPFGACSYF